MPKNPFDLEQRKAEGAAFKQAHTKRKHKIEAEKSAKDTEIATTKADKVSAEKFASDLPKAIHKFAKEKIGKVKLEDIKSFANKFLQDLQTKKIINNSPIDPALKDSNSPSFWLNKYINEALASVTTLPTPKGNFLYTNSKDKKENKANLEKMERALFDLTEKLCTTTAALNKENAKARLVKDAIQAQQQISLTR